MESSFVIRDLLIGKVDAGPSEAPLHVIIMMARRSGGAEGAVAQKDGAAFKEAGAELDIAILLPTGQVSGLRGQVCCYSQICKDVRMRPHCQAAHVKSAH